MKQSTSQLSIVKAHATGKSGADATTTGRLLRRRTVSVNAGKGEYKSTQQDQPRPTEGDKKFMHNGVQGSGWGLFCEKQVFTHARLIL